MTIKKILTGKLFSYNADKKMCVKYTLHLFQIFSLSINRQKIMYMYVKHI